MNIKEIGHIVLDTFHTFKSHQQIKMRVSNCLEVPTIVTVYLLISAFGKTYSQNFNQHLDREAATHENQIAHTNSHAKIPSSNAERSENKTRNENKSNVQLPPSVPIGRLVKGNELAEAWVPLKFPVNKEISNSETYLSRQFGVNATNINGVSNNSIYVAAPLERGMVRILKEGSPFDFSNLFKARQKNSSTENVRNRRLRSEHNQISSELDRKTSYREWRKENKTHGVLFPMNRIFNLKLGNKSVENLTDNHKEVFDHFWQNINIYFLVYYINILHYTLYKTLHLQRCSD